MERIQVGYDSLLIKEGPVMIGFLACGCQVPCDWNYFCEMMVESRIRFALEQLMKGYK